MVHRIDAGQLDGQFRAAGEVGASLAVTTRPVTAAPDRATTMPSTIKSPARDPWKTVFDWVVALSSVSVMRIGITVPAGRVTVLATGGGGGGGGGGHHLHRLLGRRRRRWRRRGRRRGCRLGHFLVPLRLLAPAFAALAGATTRLLTTVLTPSTEALSAAASAREASLSTLPFRVATPLATLTWMFWPVQCGLARRSWPECRCRSAGRLAGEGVPAAGRSGRCLLCGRRGLFRRRILAARPRTRKPVKTVSGMLRRIRKSVFMGKSSVFDSAINARPPCPVGCSWVRNCFTF